MTCLTCSFCFALLIEGSLAALQAVLYYALLITCSLVALRAVLSSIPQGHRRSDLLVLQFCFALLITGSLAALRAVLLKFVGDTFMPYFETCSFLALGQLLVDFFSSS